MGEVHVDAQPSNQHSGIAAHLFGMGYVFLYFLFPAVRQHIHTNAVVGKRESSYNDRRVLVRPEAITLAQHLLAVKRSVMSEKLVQVSVATRERTASRDNFLVQW